MASILIVEDDKRINELMRRTLTALGHRGFTAFSGREALTVISKERPDLILLDLNLPDLSGYDILDKITDIPVICVTARGEIKDRVKGLNKGALDYLVKPFAVAELAARIQAALRRFHKEQTVFILGEVKVDMGKAVVERNESPVNLTNQEYELLKALLENRNLALSRSQLLDLAWGLDYYGEERTVDVHIRRLRQKLGLEDCLKTVFKYGYRLEI